MKNCVYRFLDKNNNIIYVGKAKNLKSRLNSHNHLSEKCYDEIEKIEYISFGNENDMDFAERYFIHKENPKYNKILSDKPINLNVANLDILKWISYNKDYKNENNENIVEDKMEVITLKDREELSQLRVKEDFIRELCRETSRSDDMYEIFNSKLDEAIENTKKKEKSIIKKLIKNGISEALANTYVKYNMYSKKEIVNKELKEIEDRYLNKCLEDINKNGYYKQDIYVKIDECFLPSYSFNYIGWHNFLGGDYASIYPDKIVVDNNIKNSLVSNIIKNIELKVSQIHGEMQKDLIVLKGNDHWANGLHKYKSIERDIPYIIYRVSK